MGSEGVNNSLSGNKYTGSPLGESPVGLFIGVIRGSGNIVRTAPLNHLVYTECTVIGALQSFHTFDYFTKSQLHGDTCPLRLGLHPSCFPGLWPVEASASVLEPPAQ
jgi:hypothetical protein